MKKKNPHIGSSFSSFLDAEGLTQEVAARAKNLPSSKLYCCGTAWQTEIDPPNPDAIDFYSTVASLKKQKNHQNCGIVEVEVRLRRWVKKPSNFKDLDTPARKRKKTAISK